MMFQKSRPYRATPYFEHPLYAPVEGDTFISDLGLLKGEIPSDLNGAFARVGPNPRFAPNSRYHWFDGAGMVHAVTLKKGRASYSRRFIATDSWNRESVAGHPLTTGLIEPKSISNLKHFLRYRNFLAPTSNTALVPDGESLIATHYLGTEAYRLETGTFSTREKVSFSPRKFIPSAHPKRDPATGNLLFFSGSPRSVKRVMVEISPLGEILFEKEFSLRQRFLMHDFAFTENFHLILDFPTDPTSRPEETLRHVRANRNIPGRFGIVSRRDPKAPIQWIETDPGVVLHTVNAYETGGEIVLHAIAFLDGTFGGILKEWRIGTQSGRITVSDRDDVLSEFPRINDARLGRPHRYAYVPGLANLPTFGFNRIAKYDFEGGGIKTFELTGSRFASEPVFVPRSLSQEEDDGYLLTLVTDGEKNRGELVILDTKDLDLVGQVEIPTRVPMGFHAAFV